MILFGKIGTFPNEYSTIWQTLAANPHADSRLVEVEVQIQTPKIYILDIAPRITLSASVTASAGLYTFVFSSLMYY